jgi:membrane-associated phospholipid phosphatase
VNDRLSVPDQDILAPIEDADAAVAERLAPYRETPVVEAASFVSKLSDQPPLRVLCAAVLLAGAVRSSPRLVRAAVRMLAAHTLATEAKSFVKGRINRRRPNARETGDDHRLSAGDSDAKADTSFPSGHSAGAIAVAGAFAREFPEHRLAALAIGSALGAAQVTRGSHYPSDVGAGLAIGLVSEVVVDQLLALVPPAPWPFVTPQSTPLASTTR